MALRAFVAAVLAGLVVLFLGNALFHGFLARSLFDRELEGVILPLKDAKNPLYPILAGLLLALPTAHAILRGRRTRAAGAISGALVGLAAYGTWNVINLELIPRWSWTVMAIDIPWHVAHGALAGFSAAVAVQWTERRASSTI